MGCCTDSHRGGPAGPARRVQRCDRPLTIHSWVSLTGARHAATLGAHVRGSPAGALEGDGMTCPRCQQENPAEALFCMKCGTGLTPTCAKCNTELPTGAAFCFVCGQPVAVAPARQRFASPDAYTPKHLAE